MAINLPTHDLGLGGAIMNRLGTDIPNHTVPFEYFGAVAVTPGETMIDNAQAFSDAVDWCAANKGQVILGAGVYGVDGPVQLKSFSNFRGLAPAASQVRQMTQGQDVFTSADGSVAGTSIAFCQFRDFFIHGGWQMNWSHDLASLATGAGIRLQGHNQGPDDQTAYDWLEVGYISDPHHLVENVMMSHILGSGLIMAGRGEMQIHKNFITRCAMYGIESNSPDNWYSNNTISSTGDSGHKITAGNNRLMNEKYWFCGSRKDIEGVGAGFEMDGSGIINVVGTNICTQDTWGPGMIFDGDAPMISGQIDEPAGGRLEQQLGGYEGSRVKMRSAIRMAACQNGKFALTVQGGGRTGAGNEPYLIDFNSSGSNHNEFDIRSLGATLKSNPIRTSGGYRNAQCFDSVKLNGQQLITPSAADLASATHSLNTVSHGEGVGEVMLDDGTLARRKADGTWTVFSGASVTPA